MFSLMMRSTASAGICVSFLRAPAIFVEAEQMLLGDEVVEIVLQPGRDRSADRRCSCCSAIDGVRDGFEAVHRDALRRLEVATTAFSVGSALKSLTVMPHALTALLKSRLASASVSECWTIPNAPSTARSPAT